MFIEKFFSKNTVTENDLLVFLEKKEEEGMNLEYKSTSHIEVRKKDIFFKNLASDIAAMANAEGGIIIIGVEELPDKQGKNNRIIPGKPEWNNIITREGLDQTIRDRIRFPIRGLRIVPITKKGEGAVFLIDIPPGDNPPYQANGNKYPARLNFTTRDLFHYEIADFFGKRRSPHLELHIEPREGGRVNNKEYITLKFKLKNRGKSIAKYPFALIKIKDKIEIVFSSLINESNNNPGKLVFSYRDNNRIIYPAGPNENIGELAFFKSSLDKLNFEVQLFAENMAVIRCIYELEINQLPNYRMHTQELIWDE